MNYHRICTHLGDKGRLYPEDTNWSKFVKNEAYISIYKYNEDHFKIFKDKGSIAGITDVVTNILYFDFDSDDLEESRNNALMVLDRLIKKGIPENSINISFSGNKGFHLAVHTDTDYSPKQVKNFAISISGDIPTFDDGIYNASRLIRLDGSINPNTLLHKIQLTKDELERLPIDEIKGIAVNKYEYIKPKKCKLPKDLTSLMEDPAPLKKDKEEIQAIGEIKVDYLSNPYKLMPRKLAISQGIFPSGQRSNSLMILAATLKYKGLLKTQCYFALKAASDLQAERFGGEKLPKQEIWKNIINQVYGEGWQGKTYAEENFPNQLKQFFDDLEIPEEEFKDVINDTVGIEDKFDEFVNYAIDIEKYTMRTGIPLLDDKLKIRKGHLIGLIAPPSVGKTSFAITLLNNTSKENINSYFGSYDMFSLNVYQKLIQRHTGLPENELYDIFKKKDKEAIERFRKILKDNYSNVTFCFKSGQTVEEIRKSIKMEEERSDKKIELVVVDYLELVRTDKADPTISSAEAIQGLREIANEGRVVLVLLQPNKLSSKINEPMTSYNSAKGSSSIAQACTAILGCWREGMSPDTPDQDEFFSINILKNRNGPLASMDFHWDGLTQTISELDKDQRLRLQCLRDLKKETNEDDKYGGI